MTKLLVSLIVESGVNEYVSVLVFSILSPVFYVDTFTGINLYQLKSPQSLNLYIFIRYYRFFDKSKKKSLQMTSASAGFISCVALANQPSPAV